MPQIADPAKVFNFVLEISGIDSWAVQTFTPPETTIEATAHGGANSDVKTAGRVTIGTASFAQLKPLPAMSNETWNWFKSAQDTKKGGGQLSSVYKKMVVVKEMYPDGKRTARRWILEGCWISGISQNEFTRTGSDNVLETVTLTVDDVDKL